MTRPQYVGQRSSRMEKLITLFGSLGIGVYLLLHYGAFSFNQTFHLTTSLLVQTASHADLSLPSIHVTLMPEQLVLQCVLLLGGVPLIYQLLSKLARGQVGADILAAVSIITASYLHEYLAGSLVVLMLSGGAVLEAYAVRKASSVLEALASRLPTIAHKKQSDSIIDMHTDQVSIGDVLVIYPHELCPVDGLVIEGVSTMDESYLTGEPYLMEKTTGSAVMSGAINGTSALTIKATKLAIDSRYAKIMTVMENSQQHRPTLRRLGDQLGSYYTPLALVIACLAWWLSADEMRFLAVLVIATPCPLLIAIPVTIISSISLAAKREIIIKNPAILETISSCSTAIFDKTGTLTYGRPVLTKIYPIPSIDEREVLSLVASVERFSKHPLSSAIINAATHAGVSLVEVTDITEAPGAGMTGVAAKKTITITHRKNILLSTAAANMPQLPPVCDGLECLILIDNQYVATMQFRDEIRADSSSFITHLQPNHLFNKVMLVSGDRESEVRFLAEQVGIKHVFYNQSPEQKLALVRAETAKAKTIFLGDGINDAPALMAATIGIAFGQNSDITSQAADAVIMNSKLLKVDELIHIGKRMRIIALQSAIGGMGLSIVGMVMASMGLISPINGALAQEFIDLFAVLNALRAAIPPKNLTDF